MEKNELLINIYKIHTTYLGISRIKRNLGIEEDVVEFCKNKVLDKKSLIYRKGKNWYIENGDIKITINATSYTIITAQVVHIMHILFTLKLKYKVRLSSFWYRTIIW